MTHHKKRITDDICQSILERLPSQLFGLQHDLQRTVKEVIQQTLQKFDLVTREEFDTQNKVLQRAKAQLAALEQKVHECEAELAKK